MTSETALLLGTAVSIGFFHTITGPDHYLPFIAMSKARQWNLAKTLFITFVCGLGHILGSVILGFVGIFLGVAVLRLENVEATRGDLAAWFLIIFGLTYAIWGWHKAIRHKSHKHVHIHEDGEAHSHVHSHLGTHSHVHFSKKKKNITPWVLFTIFVLGPCEPLIPILMYPAAKGSLALVVTVTMVFGLTTIATMMGVVILSYASLTQLSFGRMEKYSHAIAGVSIFLCGSAIKFLGL